MLLPSQGDKGERRLNVPITDGRVGLYPCIIAGVRWRCIFLFGGRSEKSLDRNVRVDGSVFHFRQPTDAGNNTRIQTHTAISDRNIQSSFSLIPLGGQ